MRILILGGYGVFGGRLAELLLSVTDLEIIISGRDLNRAKDFCNTHNGNAALTPLRLDRCEIGTQLTSIAPDIVVDASGPFQSYGHDGYAVIVACIKAKVNYLDFADATNFVFGVSRFDQEAKEAGVFVLSGASSFPVLTACVLREMSKSMEVHSLKGGIAPSPYAGIGLNVMRAVIGYAGAPITLLRDGKKVQALGLVETMRYTIAVPGKLPLKNIHFSLVDVPDLQVIPSEHSTLQSIWMGAGPVPEVLHRLLNLLARTRAIFKFPSFVPFSRLFYWVLNLLKYGEHRGGMFIHAQGISNDNPVEKSWHLLAEGDDGPYIPSMAIEAIVQKVRKREEPAAGARPATQALELEDYKNLFAGKSISMGFRGDENKQDTLFRSILAEAFEQLPEAVKAFHDSDGSRIWKGRAEVQRGSGFLANLVCRIFGFPKNSRSSVVRVVQSQVEGGEQWIRTFNDRSFNSILKIGLGKNSYLLTEQFGIVQMALALVLDKGKLHFVPRKCSVFSIPLPKILMPSGNSFEEEKDGLFIFHINIVAPIVGHIVSYKGFLERG
ncbi:DUF4166 domain-containing protein [Microbulbifer sp. 2304DJ12-6]|uniref:SDR family oxidoreductase n=1 Tax=Microbulbifer sp. 2304DJ12-6 TaxID=3233340 RepID=UPI0039AF0C39